MKERAGRFKFSGDSPNRDSTFPHKLWKTLLIEAAFTE
jgi:hypothetical protein